MNRIAESELIINSRGAVYHLDLRPEELANTIITVGDPTGVLPHSRNYQIGEEDDYNSQIRRTRTRESWLVEYLPLIFFR
jgi:hypothetical protein